MSLGGILRAAMRAKDWGRVARQSRELSRGRNLLPVVNEFPLRQPHLERLKSNLELRDAFRRASDVERGFPWEGADVTLGRIRDDADRWMWNRRMGEFVEPGDVLGSWYVSTGGVRPFLPERWQFLRDVRNSERAKFGRARGELWPFSRNRRTGEYNDPEFVRRHEQAADDAAERRIAYELDVAEGYYDAYQDYLRYGTRGDEPMSYDDFTAMLDRNWQAERQQQLQGDSPMFQREIEGFPALDPFSEVDDAFGKALEAWERSGRRMSPGDMQNVMRWERQMPSVPRNAMRARPGYAGWFFDSPPNPFIDINLPRGF